MTTAVPAAESIAVLGAGSWGTALAIQFARAGCATHLWARDAKQLETIARERRNARYLPEARFPEGLVVSASLGEALRGSRDILIAVPSQGFRALLASIKPHLTQGQRVAWATKGFELASGKLPHQVAKEVLGGDVPVAVLSGPTFAKEVGAGLPTAMTIASADEDFAAELAQGLSGLNFRAYTSSDIVGVEVGGAVKNVLAIGAGISDGIGYGANTRIALICRGLAEMTRLGVALGAQIETFMGLAGLGDLVLTSTDDQSRNRRFGLALARGTTAEQAIAEIGQVVEGAEAARALYQVAARLKVDMPICTAIYRIVHEGLPIREAVAALMSREVRAE